MDTNTIGIIPTRVGTRLCPSHNRRTSWDHPHACGDKLSLALPSVMAVGSSPRVWGQGDSVRNCWIMERIIPTRVGTRFCHSRRSSSSQNHPHACGDKMPLLLKSQAKKGSSPRVWGQVRNSVLIFTISRIIPTRVGTSGAIHAHALINEDHPHACGDK